MLSPSLALLPSWVFSLPLWSFRVDVVPLQMSGIMVMYVALTPFDHGLWRVVGIWKTWMPPHNQLMLGWVVFCILLPFLGCGQLWRIQSEIQPVLVADGSLKSLIIHISTICEKKSNSSKYLMLHLLAQGFSLSCFFTLFLSNPFSRKFYPISYLANIMQN